jgi:hypothetical protein
VAEPNLIETPDGTVSLDKSGTDVLCQWTWRCREEATSLEPHPAFEIGHAAVCPQHRAWIDRMAA